MYIFVINDPYACIYCTCICTWMMICTYTCIVFWSWDKLPSELLHFAVTCANMFRYTMRIVNVWQWLRPLNGYLCERYLCFLLCRGGVWLSGGPWEDEGEGSKGQVQTGNMIKQPTYNSFTCTWIGAWCADTPHNKHSSQPHSHCCYQVNLIHRSHIWIGYLTIQ